MRKGGLLGTAWINYKGPRPTSQRRKGTAKVVVIWLRLGAGVGGMVPSDLP